MDPTKNTYTFASSILDQISRSMDDGNENFYDNRVVKTTSMYPPSSASGILDDICRPMDGGNENQSQGRSVMDEDMASRACLLKHETTSVSKRPKPVKTTTVSKKEKQPIWPGAKLASLFKSLFTNGNSKKTKKRKAESTQACTCSWASTCSAAVREILKGHAKNAMVLRNENASGNEDDYDDAASDSSSDFFAHTKEGRYNPKMHPVIPVRNWRKGSQWVVLTRKHAEIIVKDDTIFPLFQRHCKLDIRWLRDKIGFVGQEPHLFHMDVKSNISYGCSRDIKQQDAEWAAKQANAQEFISSLPNGYVTHLLQAIYYKSR
ncbi:unnamed protein product [Camellia sinensis]